MKQAVLAAVAAAAFLSGAALATPASAMMLGRPSAFGVAGGNATLLERVVNVCGINGCSPIHVKRVRKPPAGFVRRAAPLVFPVANTRQIQATQPANK